MKKGILFLTAIILITTAQAQVSSRLIGLTKAVFDGTSFSAIGDTAWYQYSAHKDTLNNGQLAYDSSYLMAYMPGFTPGNQSYRYYHTMDTSNNLADAITQRFDSTTMAWVNTEHSIYIYDTGNNMVHQVRQTWDPAAAAWVNNANFLNTYVANNNTLRIQQVWNVASSGWVNTIKDSLYYNTAGDMTYHLTQRWDTTALLWQNLNQVIDTYNTTHGIVSLLRQVWLGTSSSWQNNAHSDYHYNTSNLLCNTISQRWDTASAVWIGTSMDSIVYYSTTSDKWRQTRYRWDTAAHDFIYNSIDAFSYDAAHNVVTDTTRRWNNAGGGSFINSKLRSFTYNGSNQILTNTTATWSNTGAWFYKFTPGTGPNNGPDQQFRYYYELNNVGVSNIGASNNVQMQLYPNPATNNITLHLQWEEVQPFMVTIMDIKGGLVSQWNETPVKNYTKVIALNNLASGTYLIRAYSKNKQAVQQFIVTE